MNTVQDFTDIEIDQEVKNHVLLTEQSIDKSKTPIPTNIML